MNHPSMDHNRIDTSAHVIGTTADAPKEPCSRRRMLSAEGNGILRDSPEPDHPPPYAGPDEELAQSKKSSSASSSNGSNRRKYPSFPEGTKPRRVIGNYTLVSTLGSGSMGKVRLAVHNITGDKLAVKIVPKVGRNKKEGKDENREIRTIREASIMLLLHHPYIVSLKEMVVLDSYNYLFMEYVNGGQLLDYIISHGKLKEKHARRFARQIASALDYCHRNSIVHRDLKIENILISSSGHIKIIDFGLSNLFSPQSHLSTFCGSLYFAAPELLHAKIYTGPEVDVWSFGVVLFVLVCGKVPFDDQNMPALHDKIKRGVVEYPSHLSSECKSLLCRMLVTNPNHRATVSEIIVHPWMNRGYDNPVDNHLPDRAPLTLPVDPEVIKGMTGFEFGTEAEIRQQLEAIIVSDEYQKAAKKLATRSAELHRNSSQSRFSHSPFAEKKSFTMPNDDPQSIPLAYHPLVSIYYLVKERMDRERRGVENGPSSYIGAGSLDDITSAQIPNISLPETAHASNVVDPSMLGTAGVAYGKKGKTNIRVDDEGHILDTDRHHFLENGLNRLFSRPGRLEAAPEEIDEIEPSSSKHKEPGVFRRLSLAIGRNSTDRRPSTRRRARNQSVGNNDSPSAAAGQGQPPAPLPSRSENQDRNKIQSDSFTESSDEFDTANNNNNINNDSATFGNKLSHLLTRVTSNESTRKCEGRLSSVKGPAQELPQMEMLPQHHHHEQVFPPNIHGYSSQQGTADENIRPVFLKGLFSVTTTSTKHPSVMRADLIRVLERIGVKWRESKGRFECVHIPSIDMNRVVTEDDRCRSFISDESNHKEEAVSSAAPVTVPDLVVRFEIYIVKVPWLLGMHGIQFRRVSGDSWQYKTMCSRILAELKL
ncbi:serine/threonine-protein kinase KIN2 [Apophysomyces ossiformis]|uniref:non-specific serine/threonine protein kinase n=1 Tax=Apophysomyces ossiformis TaxID=679940 RepID=A0A8H7EVL2_9FUNG|nr:serine/threonine-protein kinase KIN2 [Apophysomyces ossiformis]